MARQEQYEELTDMLQKVFIEHPIDYWQLCLTTHDIPHAPISSIDQVVRDPQVLHNGVFKELHHPTMGIIKNTQRPILYDGDRSGGEMPPPILGEHSVDVLIQLGFDQEIIDLFLKEGVISKP